MRNTIIGVLLAAFAQFLLGFLYFGGAFHTLPYQALDSAANDAAAQAALAAHFPRSGSYQVPNVNQPPEVLQNLVQNGPTAVIHLTAPPQTGFDPAMLGVGFAHNVVVCALLAWVLTMAGLADFGQRLLLVVVAGLAATIAIDLGGVIWWQVDLAWALVLALYNLLAWLAAGLVLARFIRPASNI